MTSTKIKTRKVITFALPTIITGMLERPVYYIIPSIYAKYFGLDLAMIGSILLLARIFDVITDPLIGYLSDNTKTSIGRRKPWIICSVVITTLSTYFLFSPPVGVSNLYFAVSFCVLFLGWTMFEIPMAAWQAELSHDHNDRSRIVAYRIGFNLIGGIVFAVMPLTPFFQTSDITPEVLSAIGWFIIIAMPVFTLIAVFFVPSGQESVIQKMNDSIFKILKSIANNLPARSFFIAFMLFGASMGVLLGAFFLYVDAYLKLGHRLPWILASISIANVCAVPFWLKTFNYFERHKIWAIGGSLASGCILCFSQIVPGNDNFVAVLVLSIGYGFCSCAIAIAYPAILADIADYDVMKTGYNRTGSYYAIVTFLNKAFLAAGGAVSFWILAFFDFNPNAEIYTDSQSSGILISMVYIPAPLLLISSIIMWFFPLGIKQQSIIKRRIELQNTRQS